MHTTLPLHQGNQSLIPILLALLLLLFLLVFLPSLHHPGALNVLEVDPLLLVDRVQTPAYHMKGAGQTLVPTLPQMLLQPLLIRLFELTIRALQQRRQLLHQLQHHVVQRPHHPLHRPIRPPHHLVHKLHHLHKGIHLLPPLRIQHRRLKFFSNLLLPPLLLPVLVHHHLHQLRANITQT
ncbi:unnamed protein product [Closterium sp. NIES-54]